MNAHSPENWREFLKTEFPTSLVTVCGELDDDRYFKLPTSSLLKFLLELQILGDEKILRPMKQGAYLWHYDSSQRLPPLSSHAMWEKLRTEFTPAVSTLILQYSVFQDKNSLYLVNWNRNMANSTPLAQPHLVLVVSSSQQLNFQVEDLFPFSRHLALVLTSQ